MSEPFRIMLAEDNAGDVLLIRQAIEEQGLEFELIVAEDGEEALSLLRELSLEDGQRFDLVLIDLNLPRVDGPEIFEAVRGNAATTDIPLIVVSSSGTLKDREWTAKFNVQAYFRKPSDLEEYMQLGKLVSEALTDRAAGTENNAVNTIAASDGLTGN